METGRVELLREGYLKRGHSLATPNQMSSVYPRTLFQSPRPGQTLGLLCQPEKKRECELGGGGVSTSWGESVPVVQWPHSLASPQGC